MDREGPPIEALTRRLAECPEDFLLPPVHPESGAEGVIDVGALFSDHFRALGVLPPPPGHLAALAEGPVQRLRLAALVTWLLHDDWFLGQPALAPQTWTLIAQGLDAVCMLLSADKAVTDPDRREELARLCLARLGLRPAGESKTQAADRLGTLDSVERERVTRETRKAENRARKVREQMAKRAAEEAAAKVSRE